MADPLAPLRRSVRPQAQDTLETLAQRELPDQPLESAVESLRAWNPHLGFGRRNYQYLLVSDIIYLDAPPEA